MTRSVTWRGNDDNCAIAENVVVAVQNLGFAVLERCEPRSSSILLLRRLFGKHHIPLGSGGKPSGTRKFIPVGGVIVVIMREGQVSDVRRFVPDFRQLPAQRFVDRRSRL